MEQYLDRCTFGDVRSVLRQMIASGVQVNTIVTSPPYWGLRSYLPDAHPDKPLEIGSEPTIGEFIATMVEVFDLCRQVLRDDGTMWVNMGDSYAANGGRSGSGYGNECDGWKRTNRDERGRSTTPRGLKPKDLIGQPWRLAFALQDAGWYLRQDIICHKPNPMPESIRDRCTKAHEYLFLLSKSERYHYDFDAMQEPVSGTANQRRATIKTPDGWDTGKGSGGHGSFHRNGREKGHARELSQGVGRRQGPPGNPAEADLAAVTGRLPGNVNPPKGQLKYENGAEEHRTKAGLLNYARKLAEAGSGAKNNASMDEALAVMPTRRNRRSVWTIGSEPYSGAHFATFPRALVEPCILAGCPPGGVVLDPFFGSGTAGQVAQQLGRRFIGIELNRANEPLQADRLRQPSLMLEAA